jgi:hypothetical protein
MTKKTAVKSYRSGEIIEAAMTGLTPNTQYYYRMMTQPSSVTKYTVAQTGSFHTQRKAGQSFTFTIQANPHRDENSDLSLYRTALMNVLKDKPDFHVDLGDTFMGEKLGRTSEGTTQRYLEDRSYFSLITSSIPLFLVNGNHEGECGWERLKGSDNIAMWASSLRLKYFLNPKPDSFYSGSQPGQGNYYAFTWGNSRPFQILCKPPCRCRIRASVWRFC